MATLHLLGTGSALTSADRTTTMLAVHEDGSTILIDCGGDVIHRALAAGLPVDSIDAMIVTHEHPDHVSGFPLFIEKLWLARRTRPVFVYGIRPAIDQARRCWDAFDTTAWIGVPPIEWKEIPEAENADVLKDDTWEFSASPGVHGVPVVGLRITSRLTGGCVVYSSDTEPCDTIERLATGCDLLVHEANGKGKGHTSAQQAAQIARAAGADRLVLVHLPVATDAEELRLAKEVFPAIEKGADLTTYEF